MQTKIILAKAGVLDGKNATGNKEAWATVTKSSTLRRGRGLRISELLCRRQGPLAGDKALGGRWKHLHCVWRHRRQALPSLSTPRLAETAPGIDGFLQLLEDVYGKEHADAAATTQEYTRWLDPNDDPFARALGLK
jgi:hypothetical protein